MSIQQKSTLTYRYSNFLHELSGKMEICLILFPTELENSFLIPLQDTYLDLNEQEV